MLCRGTCRIKEGVPQAVTWSRGRAWSYHGTTNRGNAQVTFIPGTDPLPTLPPDTRTLNLNIGNVTVPSQETTYLCRTFELPNDKKYHIVRYEPIIDTARLLHHMVVFFCARRPDDVGTVSECLMSPSQNCQSVRRRGVGGGGGFM